MLETCINYSSPTGLNFCLLFCHPQHTPQDLFSSPSQNSWGIVFSCTGKSLPWLFCSLLFFTWYKAADEGMRLSLPPVLVKTQPDSKCVWFQCGLSIPCYLQLINIMLVIFHSYDCMGNGSSTTACISIQYSHMGTSILHSLFAIHHVFFITWP